MLSLLLRFILKLVLLKMALLKDNDNEFSAWKDIQEILDTAVYFYHPYVSYEKSTNEKYKEIIRYFMPKGTLIENYSNRYINNTANWTNIIIRLQLKY